VACHLGELKVKWRISKYFLTLLAMVIVLCALIVTSQPLLAFGFALLPLFLFTAMAVYTRYAISNWRTHMFVMSVWLLLLFTSFDLGARVTADLVSTLLNPFGALRVGTILMVALYVAITVARNGMPHLLRFTPATMYLLYTLLAISLIPASTSPMYSLYKAFEILVALLFLIVVVSQDPSRKEHLWNASYCFLIFIVIVVAVVSLLNLSTVFRQATYSAFDSGWRYQPPILLTANGLGAVSAVVAGVAFVRFAKSANRRRTISLAVALLSMVVLIVSQSRTSLLALAAFLLIAAISVPKIRRLGASILAILSSLLLFSPSMRQGALDFLIRGMAREELTSLTGRTALWRESLSAFWEAPLFGYGFSVGTRSVIDQAGVTSALNGFLEVALNVGIAGFVPFLLSLGLTGFVLLRLSLRSPRGRGGCSIAIEAVPVFIVIIARTITSTGAGGWYTPDLLIFLLVMVCLGGAEYEVPLSVNPRFLSAIQAPRRIHRL
jgi:O-antigen ligase